MNNTRYTYRTVWSEEDQEYAGLCDQFPSLSWLSQSQEEAMEGIRRLVKEYLAGLKAGQP